MSEMRTIFPAVMLAASRGFSRLFKNTVGTGWTGAKQWLRAGQVYHARGGELLITGPRPLDAGLFVGSGDGIGWESLLVTEDMVGKRVAIFLSVETKSATGRLRKEQKTWLDQVRAAGGIAIVARSADEFTELLSKYQPR